MKLLPQNGYVIMEIEGRKSAISTPKEATDSIQTGKVHTLPEGGVPNMDIQVGDLCRWIKFAEKEGRFEHESKTLAAVDSANIMVIFRR